MEIKIITEKIGDDDLRELAKEFYITMIKGVVDLEREIVALGGEYHMDANNVLIDNGSIQPNVWGFNIYLDKNRDEQIEYTSLINIRPNQSNFSLELTDQTLRDRVLEIVKKRTNLWK